MAEIAVDIEGLGFSYHDGREALKGVTLAVARGDRLAVVGANGAGKSTLLWHINGLLSGDGRIRVHGLDVGQKGNLRRVRRLVGLLFQEPDDMLFSPTVMDDVCFGPLAHGLGEAEAREKATEALSAVGLEGFGQRSPHHLSYGEKKRVALAAVLAMGPEVLALDEPTANLDPRSRRQLMAILRGYRGTLIIATHDLEAALALCVRAVVLEGGRVAADGETRSILSDAALMEKCGLEVPTSLNAKK